MTPFLFSVIANESTLDSLADSVDNLCYENDIIPHKTPERANNFENNNVQGKTRSNMTSEKCREGVSRFKEKENNTLIIPSDHNDLLENVQDTLAAKGEIKSSTVKSKISKRKTFDDSLSVSNNRSGNINFHYSSSNCGSINRNSNEGCASQATLSLTSGQSYHKACIPDKYRTPTQRKDVLIRDLKRQIRDMKIACDVKDREIAMYKQHADEETSKLVQAKDEELASLREELNQLKQSCDDISILCEESVTTATLMEEKAEELKNAIDDREKQHQVLYLQMYRKGQDSTRFEREGELERLASAGGCKVTISELVRKLAWTELELAKWQTLRSQESYQSAPQPDTEADTTLKFLKDLLFHYITDARDSGRCLRAMIQIFKYTDPKIEKIKESKLIRLMEKRHKSKSKRKF